MKKNQIFKIILNEQTPKTNFIKNTEEWIDKNSNLLNSFLFFSLKNNKAAALSANQVSLNGDRIMDRFFSIRENGNGEKWRIIINPKIIETYGDLKEFEEGCLTWPGKKIIAKRYPKIKVSFFRISGLHVEDMIIDGFESQVWQHEIDHLNGIEEQFKTVENQTRIEINRNEKCPCGSNIKYKKCCGK